jgi:peptidoglycan hydrolase-like protein with peptidoglycan-binding domain
MDVLEAHGRAPIRMRPWMVALAVLSIVALIIVFSGGSNGGKGNHSGAGASGTTTPSTIPALLLSDSSPKADATAVPTDSTITLTFSSPVSLHKAKPTLSPTVAGTWSQSSPTTLEFDPSAPFIPSSREIVTVPGGPHGLLGTNGSALATTPSVAFTVADGTTLRLQQLLAQLNYLPLAFTPTGPAPAAKEMAVDQPGSFAFRWSTLPPQLTSQWSPGVFGEVTKAAVMAFESQNNQQADGLAGPVVWSTLLAAAAAQKVDPNPYVYVLVNKAQPESLTLWNNGVADVTNVLVNTGAPGADTTDGTYAVFEHVRFSEMKGTNPDGTKYDDPNIPYASYFFGGDALHGYIRPHYGYPQSNGCVEMSYANAAVVWPLTPIGTVVTVVGPASPALPPPTTTTTTAPPAATTTTVAPTTTPTT